MLELSEDKIAKVLSQGGGSFHKLMVSVPVTVHILEGMVMYYEILWYVFWCHSIDLKFLHNVRLL
jgi:hypothetical protein